MHEVRKTLKVVIATPFGEGGKGGMDRLTDAIIEKVHVREDLGVRARHLVTRGEGPLFWSNFIFAAALIKFLIATMRSDVDLLHINLAAGGSAYRKLLIARLARHRGIPYVVHLHGSRFHEFWPALGPRACAAVNRLFIESAEIIVLGKFWEQLVINRLPQLKNKITILPNATTGVVSRRDRDERQPLHIAFLGVLGPRKGTPQLIDALGRLPANGNWRATIAGNGEVEEARAQVNRLGMADRVAVPGWLGAAGVASLLASTDIFVLPSFAENLPMAILEAFAHGIPVIATPVGAVPEVVDHERNGLIVPVGDVEQLSAALKRLIDDPQLRRNLGETARRDHAQHFEMTSYVVRLAAIWRRAAASALV